MALQVETLSVSLPKTQTHHLFIWSQAIDMCLLLFFSSLTLSLVRLFQAVWRFPRIRSLVMLGISALFSSWAAQNPHDLSLCGARGFFVCL